MTDEPGGHDTIDALLAENRRFPPPDEFKAEALVTGTWMYDEAAADDQGFWARQAAELLDWLPPASLAAIDLLYPDPWPKFRHWKRRFVSEKNLTRFARVLRPGGLFRFASDIESYVEWTLLHVRDHADFTWTARDADDWRQPWAGWPGTRYEQKAFREGRQGSYLTFQRRG